MKLFYQILKPAISRLYLHQKLSITTMGSSGSKSFSPKNMSKICSQKATKSTMASCEEYIEEVVCHESELKENEMKALELGPGGAKVLVVRQKGNITAVGNKCTHYGAPLNTGALGDGRVRCPWHGACFNITTGDIEDFPGLDSLPCYQVTVTGDGNVKVKAKKSDLESNRRVVTSKSFCSKDNSVYVIVGGGPSAATCVETLRKNACGGRIVMIAKENALPYDRIKISKALDADAEKLKLRDSQFYAEHFIDVFKGVEATKVNPEKKTVDLSNGQSLNYTALYLATGSQARKLTIPGSELNNVFTLRTVADGAAIHAAIGPGADKNVIVLGVSFIGMEAAAYCVGKVKSITVIGRDDVPFKPVFGPAIGRSLMKLFQDKGVQFKMGTNIKQCIGKDGKISSVELTDGSSLSTDVLITGVGSTFNTEFLRDSGIKLETNGAVSVNDRLETNIKGIFAGGDIAHAPVYSHGGRQASIGHFGLAHYHGKVAALNMLNKDEPLKAVPFFWTLLFGKSVRYCGHGKYHEIRIEGDVDELKFVAFFLDESGKVIGIASCQKDPIVAQFAELLAQGKSLHSSELANDPFAWVNKLNK